MKCSDLCGDICDSLSTNLSYSAKITKLIDNFHSKYYDIDLPSYWATVDSALRQTCPVIRESSYDIIKTKLEILEPLRQIHLSLIRKPKAFSSCSTEILKSFDGRMEIAFNFVMTYKKCMQQRSDITAETNILKLMADAIVKASALPLDKTGRKLLSDAFELVRTSSCATKKVRDEFSRLTYEAYKYKYVVSRMSLSMGYQRGKWTVCHFGHSYYVVDYDVLMQQPKCPICESLLRKSIRKPICNVM